MTLPGPAGGAEKAEELIHTCAPDLRAVVLIGTRQEPFSRPIARHAPHIPTKTIDPGHDEVMKAAEHHARGDTFAAAAEHLQAARP